MVFMTLKNSYLSLFTRYTYFVISDKDDLPDVIMHGGHGVGALVKDEVHFSFDLLTIGYPTEKCLNHL